MELIAGSGPLVVLLDDRETAEKLRPLLPPCSLLAFPAPDWDRDLTPWPAPGLRLKDPDFGGGAEAFLASLHKAAAEAEAALPERPGTKLLLGYSLGGLFALWAGTRTADFPLLASVSGSLWYDGWCEYLEANPCRGQRVYLSLGEKEPKARNPRMARVGACTEKTEALLRASGVETTLEWNPGGHFNEPEARMARAVRALLGDKEEQS